MLGEEWTLAIGSDGHDPAGYDLCIWDFVPGESVIPRDLGWPELKRHFFLVERSALQEFQAAAGRPDLNVLLKPVTPASMRAFLSGALQLQSDGCDGAGPGALRRERDQMLQFLIHANLKLQEYDQERTNFLARSIHEFRAPLTAVSGYCALVLEEEFGPLTAELRAAIEKMRRAVTRLSHVATAMLELSICQKAALKPTLDSADIRECVGRALAELAPFLQTKEILTSVDIAPPPEGFLFERTRLEQVLIYLLENAYKFTPRFGTIDIKGYPFFWNRRVATGSRMEGVLERRVRQGFDYNAFRIDIRDSGPRIPASHVERIFEEYTSYAGGDDRSGGGITLAICRMILQRHHGHIWAESTPQGAIFSFVLPVQQIGGSRAETRGTAISKHGDQSGEE